MRLERNQHAQRFSQHVLAQLVCLGSHTITGLLSVCGQQFKDWSADYRMYGCNRVQPEQLFDVVRRHICAMDDGPAVVALDDTRIRKTGKKTFGAKYTRDPLGPPFHVNFIRAQRFLQTSMAIKNGDGQARMVPVDWFHTPVPQKPGKKATPQERAQYEKQCELARIGLVGAERIGQLRAWMDKNQQEQRRLWSVVDGSFTNGTVLKRLPHNTTLVGRIRSDAKLYFLPSMQPDKGRRRAYGEQAPTPEQLRQDDQHPWEQLEVFFGGQKRQLRAKRITPLRWRAAGQHHDLQMIVIAPTPYRLTANGKLLYRQPAYLICTDPSAPLAEVIQHYLWRWDIEVNFRDEKALLGVGEAQVRTPAATQNVTGTAVAAYALLLLAAKLCQNNDTPIEHLPAPKWQRRNNVRITTASLIKNLRYELWAKSIHLCSFMNSPPQHTKPQKYQPRLDTAVFYAARYT